MDYYIGWDVGAWNCTKATEKSCDAVVVMNEQAILGYYRDNISNLIPVVSSATGESKIKTLVRYLFDRCGIKSQPEKNSRLYMAVDTPLGWPKCFKKLLQGALPTDWSYQSGGSDIDNPLLYRKAEQKLRSGFSMVAQSIGSQSTKGMALVLALGASHERWGVWNLENLTMIETYPKACLRSNEFVKWMSTLNLGLDIREWTKPVKKKEYDLRLVCSVKDVSCIPSEGKNLIIVASVNKVLYVRFFDGGGKVVVDTDETKLAGQAERFGELRKQVESLWPPHELTGSEKSQIINAVTSIKLVLAIQDDTFDAAVCSCLAKAFASKALPLENPPNDESDEDRDEGWIFFPAGGLINKSLANGYCSVTNTLEAGTLGIAVREFQEYVITQKNKKPAAIKVVSKL